VVAVTAAMSTQSAAVGSQRRHWWLSVIGLFPDHVPALAVRV